MINKKKPVNVYENSQRPVALITGASAGIGATFARRFAQRGCDLILVARRRERLEQLAEEIRQECSISVQILPADLTNTTDLARVCEQIRQTPNLEYLVNNAGFGLLPKFAESNIEPQDTMARLHVIAPLNLTHAALPKMIERNRGFIINVASVAAFFQSPSNVVYCSTKRWLVSFSDGLNVELAGTNVVVQALCPGFTYSEFHDVMKVNRRSVPKNMWLSADYVVKKSLQALGNGKGKRKYKYKKYLCIPSWKYKLVVLFSRILPRLLRNYFAAARHRKMLKLGLTEQM